MRQPSPPCVQQRLQMQFPARAPLELLRCAVRSPAIGGHGFSARVGVCSEALSSGTRFALLSVRGCYASPGSGGRSIMCATGCVSVATNRYLLMSGGGLALSEQEGCIAHLVWCYYESLVWYSSCLMPFDDHVALCDPVSLFVSGLRDARQSLFWQLLVLVASTNSFHRPLVHR